MKIISKTKNSTSFGAIIVVEQKVQKKILKGLNVSQLKALKKDLLEQQKNPVNALVYGDFFRLKAKIFFSYRYK